MFTSFTPNNSGLSNLNVFTNTSSSIFVIVIAVNIEANVPIVKVTANPFTGPVPNVNKIVVIIRVVIFESNIAQILC